MPTTRQLSVKSFTPYNPTETKALVWVGLKDGQRHITRTELSPSAKYPSWVGSSVKLNFPDEASESTTTLLFEITDGGLIAKTLGTTSLKLGLNNETKGNNYLLPITNGSTYVVNEKDAVIANELEGEIAKLRTWLELKCNFNSMLPWLPLRLLPAKMDSDMKNPNNDMNAIREAIKSQLEALAGWVDTDQVKKRAKEEQKNLSTAVAELRKSADDILKVGPKSNKDASVVIELRDMLYAVANGLGNKEQGKVMLDEELEEKLEELEGQKGQKLEELEVLEQEVLKMLKLKEPEESEEPNKQEERKKWNELMKEWNELELELKEKKEQKERKLKDMKNMKLKELGLEKLEALKNKVQSVIDVVMPEDSANGKKLIEHLDPQKQLLDKIVHWQLANGRVQQATGFLHIEISMIRDSE